MRVVAKYSLVLGGTLALALAILGTARVHYLRGELEEDMRHDHRVTGRVLQGSLVDIWAKAGPDASRETADLLARSHHEIETTRFDWEPGVARTEGQRVEAGELVSLFPVVVQGRPVGTLRERESMAYVDAAVRSHAWFMALGIAVIVIACTAGARLMGGWLVGRPVGLLVEQARKIGRLELAGDLAFDRRDELGELAVELRHASATLAQSLATSDAEAAARLRAVEQLRHSERLATVGQLAAGIAHELGTPLSVVAGHAQMIAGAEVTGEAALASARSIDAEVTRMGKIVRQLLDFARRQGPAGTTCDPTVIAQRSVSLLAVMAERGKVDVTVEGEPLTAAIDEDSLHQVLTNLAINAIQAMPTGGALTITSARLPGRRLRIEVRDTGTGLDPAVQAHLFEPFVTTKAPGEGTGLGLAVVHGIVTDHGGEITVESSPRGTTVSLVLQEAA